MGIIVRKMVAVGHLVHKYDEIICSIHQGGHPASHHDPPVGGPWWGSFANTTGGNIFFFGYIIMFVGNFTSVADERAKKKNKKDVLKLMIQNEARVVFRRC